jgi:hypothetical protein
VQLASLLVLEVLADTSNCAARPDAADEDIDLSISGAVVWKWIFGLAGLSNWRGMNQPASLAIASARATAPFIPSAPGVRTNSAPKPLSIDRRSIDMVSGITRRKRYPRAAQAYAKAMPVLPLVASTTLIPGRKYPCCSASQTIAAPIRHFTL